jgi:hypothetical protein
VCVYIFEEELSSKDVITKPKYRQKDIVTADLCEVYLEIS